MLFSEYLAAEWRPALGCTEPASIALATASAAALLDGVIVEVRLTCDPRTYKNCYAVAFTAVRVSLGHPVVDGIVGRDGMTSLVHLGRIATQGMRSVDAEILAIMQEKLR